MTDTHDLFISYCHDDAEYVEQLADRLQRVGVSVWYDQDIESGRKWRREIEVAIENANKVLVVLSPSSAFSDYCHKEISYAEDVENQFIPLLLEETTVPLALQGIQWIDARDGNVPLARIQRAAKGETRELQPFEQLPNAPENLELSVTVNPLDDQLGCQVQYTELGLNSGILTSSIPLEDEDLRELRWYLEQYPRWPTGPDVQRAQRIEGDMNNWGRALFNAVFSTKKAENIWTTFRERTDCNQILTIDCEESAGLRFPWELLADEHGHLSCHGVSVRRRLQHEDACEQADLELPLRILMVVSRPEGEGIGFINPRASSEVLLDAIEPLGPENCQVEFVHPPTIGALRQRLEQDPPIHVVHFDGHGVYLKKWALGYVLFEDEDGKKDLVKGKTIGGLLAEANVPVMILDACQSADIDAPDPYSSVAAEVIRAGVSAVLAMQYSVLVPASERFFAAFYGALATGATVGMATDRGRKDLLDDPLRFKLKVGASEEREVRLSDWFLPALYERMGDPAPFAGAVVRPDRAESREDLRGDCPDPPYGFVGRGRDLWKLERSLHQRRIVVLHGFGGQGKTALAVESGKWLTRTGRFERAAFLSFEHGGEADWVATQLGGLLCGDEFSSLNAEAQREQLTKALSEEATLIIWDNFESLLKGGNAERTEEALEELLDLGADLSECGESRLVVTTRDPDLPHATFTGSSRSTRQRLGGLTTKESLELAGEVLSASGQEPPGREELERLLRQLGGHPLSIQLVLPHLEECGGVGPVIDRFEELYPGFTRGKATERNESLEVSLTFSLDRLSEEVRERLPALGVFRGGAVDVLVILIAGLEPDAWMEARQELIQAGLIEQEPLSFPLNAFLARLGFEAEDAGPEDEMANVPYLRFHPTLAPHLRGRLEAERRGELEERYRRVYHALSAHLYTSDSKSPGAVRAIARREMPNLRRALRLALRAGDRAAATGMAERIERFLNVFGRWRERDAMMEEVENAAEAAGGFGEGKLTKAEFLHRSRRGEMLHDRAQDAEAERVFRTVLERFEAGVDYDEEEATYDRAQTLGRLGRSLRAQGRSAAAEREYRRALEVLGTMDQDDEDVRRQTGGVHTDLADALRDQGRYGEARGEYEESLRIKETLGGEQRGKAVVQGQLGTLALRQRDYGEARRRYEEALEAFNDLGETRHRAIALHQLGMVAQEEAQRAEDPGRRTELLEEAEARYRESLRLSESIGDTALAATSANQLAIVAKYAGRPADAERWFRRAIELDRAAGANPSQLAKRYNNLANLLLGVHRMEGEPPEELAGRDLPAEAEQWAQKARKLMEPIDDPATGMWRIYGLLAQVAEVREDAEAARAWRRKARRAFAAFPGHWANLGKQWGPIARDFGRLVRGELPEERAEELEAALRTLSEEHGWGDLVAAMGRVREGARDADALAEEQELDRQDYLILTKVLAAVEGQSVWEETEEPDRFERALRAFAPLLHAVLRVCEGNEELRPDVNEFLDGLSQHEGPRQIVAPLRRVLEGERDRDALSADLDELHTNLLGVLLKALDGEEKARSALEQLAEEAEENGRNQRQQQVMEAFQQWLQSPAGKQAREQMDTTDMSEQQVLRSLFQHFVEEQE